VFGIAHCYLAHVPNTFEYRQHKFWLYRDILRNWNTKQCKFCACGYRGWIPYIRKLALNLSDGEDDTYKHDWKEAAEAEAQHTSNIHLGHPFAATYFSQGFNDGA
jgi:hypothetical protein